MSEQRPLAELLPFGLVPELLDAVPYPALVLSSDSILRCVNAAARARFGLTEELVDEMNRERVVPEPMRELRERHLSAWLAGERPRPVPYRWDRPAGGEEFLLVPFPVPGHAGVYAAVLIPRAAQAPAASTAASATAPAQRDLEAPAPRGARAGDASLTAREWQIARRIASGDRVSLLAEDLRISPNTVRNHLKAIFRKLGVNSQPQLVRAVRRLIEAKKSGE